MLLVVPLPFLLQAGGLLLVSLFAADYLFPSPVESPNAPDTIRLPNPNASFSGGQCAGVPYHVRFVAFLIPVAQPEAIYQIELTAVGNGAVGGVYVEFEENGEGRTSWFAVVDFADSRYRYGIAGGNVTPESRTSGVRDVVVTRVDGQPDVCGNRGELPIPESGLADTIINFNSETFNDNSVTIFEGDAYSEDTDIFDGIPDLISDALSLFGNAVSGLLSAASGLASGQGASAAAAAATAASLVPAGLAKLLQLLSTLADALKAIDEILRRLRELLGKENKSIRIFPYGKISADGFSRLYPTGNPTEYEGISLELVLLTVPSTRGKIFGRKSPNQYRYEPLGRIMFTSGTLGIISTHYIEYPRVSLPIPIGATGFFYHLGLQGNVIFNASGVYYKIERAA